MVQDSAKRREDGSSDSDGGGGISNKDSEGEKNTDFELDGFPLHYTGEGRNITTRNFIQDAAHANVREEGMNFGRKGPLHGDVLSYVNYKEHGRVSTRYLWWINEMGDIPRLSGCKKVFVAVTQVSTKKRSWLVSPELICVSWMHDMARKFTRPGQLIVALFYDTSTTAQTCLDLPRHHHFWP